MKYADNLGIQKVVIIGEEEVNNEKLKIKDMVTGEEKLISLHDLD